MAFDGFTTACLAQELNRCLTGAHISKITQTEKDELLLTLKLPSSAGGGSTRLVLSADPSLPLCYLTQQNKPAPLTAPAFCMLLYDLPFCRKHIKQASCMRAKGTTLSSNPYSLCRNFYPISMISYMNAFYRETFSKFLIYWACFRL